MPSAGARAREPRRRDGRTITSIASPGMFPSSGYVRWTAVPTTTNAVVSERLRASQRARGACKLHGARVLTSSSVPSSLSRRASPHPLLDVQCRVREAAAGPQLARGPCRVPPGIQAFFCNSETRKAMGSAGLVLPRAFIAAFSLAVRPCWLKYSIMPLAPSAAADEAAAPGVP